MVQVQPLLRQTPISNPCEDESFYSIAVREMTLHQTTQPYKSEEEFSSNTTWESHELISHARRLQPFWLYL